MKRNLKGNEKGTWTRKRKTERSKKRKMRRKLGWKGKGN